MSSLNGIYLNSRHFFSPQEHVEFLHDHELPDYRLQKDPDRDPCLVLMDPDPDPGGTKTLPLINKCRRCVELFEFPAIFPPTGARGVPARPRAA